MTPLRSVSAAGCPIRATASLRTLPAAPSPVGADTSFRRRPSPGLAEVKPEHAGAADPTSRVPTISEHLPGARARRATTRTGTSATQSPRPGGRARGARRARARGGARVDGRSGAGSRCRTPRRNRRRRPSRTPSRGPRSARTQSGEPAPVGPVRMPEWVASDVPPKSRRTASEGPRERTPHRPSRTAARGTAPRRGGRELGRPLRVPRLAAARVHPLAQRGAADARP